MYVIVLRLKILRRKGLSYFGVFEKQEKQESSQVKPQPPPPPTNDRQSKGPGQETRRGTNRLQRPYQQPTRGPREGRAPNSNGRGGEATTAGARAHKHTTNTACTERTTGPSTRNAQTTWNGVPAGEDKGHPDGATRKKHREGREGGTARGGERRELAPAPPTQPAASAAQTPTGVMPLNSSSAAARKSQVAVAIALQSVNNKEASSANCE